ncbi:MULTISPECIES: hypothetical protein [Akkermansia]|uniref:hypothetical protein n=1 Tax=unclassified Akkermansia TaxID=2608915 RepID=UPI00082F7134|nr:MULTISPECIES: hypothetical protein [Akkermansia]MBT9563492.1 hypothetical protein [Candidatus Akkermansia timonensis]MBT9602255.1 hypothetical protein [Akkermansia muciniphila]
MSENHEEDLEKYHSKGGEKEMNSSISSFSRSGIKDDLGIHIKMCVPTYLHYALNTNDGKKIVKSSDMIFDEKNVEKMKNSIDWWLTTDYGEHMPSQRKIDKKQISVWIPIVLFRKFQKRAKELNMTMTEIITAYLVQQTQNVILTPEDYEHIAREIREKANNN